MLKVGDIFTNTNQRSYEVIACSGQYTLVKDMNKKLFGIDEYVVATSIHASITKDGYTWEKGTYCYSEKDGLEELNAKTGGVCFDRV